MNQIKIVTDSASDLSFKKAAELGIEIVPLTIRFGNEVFIDGKEITTTEFYEKMSTSKDLPQTSAPSPGDFEEAFKRQADAGASEIFCITLSSKFSATKQSAEIAAKNLKNTHKIHIFDSDSVSAGLLLLVLEAHKMAEAGQDANAIRLELEEYQKERLRCYGILDTVENLKKGGRVSNAKAVLSEVLNIKPIIEITKGEIINEAKVRTRKKAFEWICNKVASVKDPKAIAIGHGNAKDFDLLLDMLKEVVDLDSLLIGEIGPIVGTHGGLGVVGLGYI